MADKRLLLVEGSNDKHVILAIQGRRGIRLLDSEKKEFLVCEGIDRLLSSLPIQLKGSDIAQLGVVVDADVNPSNRWTELRSILLAAGYIDVPQTPSEQGTIIEAPTESILPRVGIWLMPDNKSSGILEDFLRFLVPTDCALLPHAQKVISTLPEKRFSLVADPKALIHTWLAACRT